MKLIFEFEPRRGIWLLLPTAILFLHGVEGPFTDLTLCWLCFGLTLRWPAK